MHIQQIGSSDRTAIRAFIRLPFRLYRGVSQWVPPFLPGEWARFDRMRFAFYRHSEAAFLLARDGSGQVVGRLAVLEHRPHNAHRGRYDALLYLYEAIEDDEVARALFDAAARWAHQRGLDRLVGPKGFLTGDGLGLLVEGFEHRPALGIPYNPPYYTRQWEGVGGFRKEVDYLSARIFSKNFVFPERMERIAEAVKRRRNLRVINFRTEAALRAIAPRLQQAYNSAFSQVWAYTPIPDEELSGVIDKLIRLAEPRYFKLVMKDDQIAGFQFSLPDISAGLQRCGGRLWPFGWLILTIERKRTRWANVVGNAVLEPYRGLGANVLLYQAMVESVLSGGFEGVDIVQIQEGNRHMLADMEPLGLDYYKRHRVYSKPI
jgi:GNAT superfamily N-acetyltransferase